MCQNTAFSCMTDAKDHRTELCNDKNSDLMIEFLSLPDGNFVKFREIRAR